MRYNDSIQTIKGIGAVKAKYFKALGINNIEDILTYYPKRYEDRTVIKPISQLTIENLETIIGTITNVQETMPRRGLSILKVLVKDSSGVIELDWFNQKFLKSKMSIGSKIIATGKIRASYYRLSMNNPEFEILDQVAKDFVPNAILPVYSANERITQKILRNTMQEILKGIKEVPENLPVEVIKKFSLVDKITSLQEIHFPKNKESLLIARHRLVFEELFLIQCFLVYVKKINSTRHKGIKHLLDSKLSQAVYKMLPFSLTKDQKKAWCEIKADMERDIPMQRLLQGDVGSGKTIIAILSLVKTVENGYQGAFMVPTEILAMQHYQVLIGLLSQHKIKVGMLVGSLKKNEKEAIVLALANGNIDIIVGTHALIQENIQFNNLGLVVTDEQHRFGVRQRALLQEKGISPDILVMTATPIPRTMTLTVYGDLDVSLIKELPPGRKPIKSFLRTPDKRSLIYQFVLREIEKGRQAYIVCPLIESSEKIDTVSVTDIFDELSSNIFKEVKCALLHGKLSKDEKDTVMKEFYCGNIKVLVSTTVIEVGVNVPNASVMVIEGAERFGLSQLHQLRGRIGRGEYQSYCILISHSNSKDTFERLSVMESVSDGFILAEEDLKLRGPGQFFGMRQHGLNDLKIADIFLDTDTLLQARLAAAEVINDTLLFNKFEPILKSHYKEYWENINFC
ncbi:ATP-dependent DNA helicase RecG [Anaerosinus gibii]|uniref:ATP-dependent DNA helicase RecG n=1 Tax=Selenobaculum gibii TaxID=3054208 RepID=A0A9Y2EVX9_9FIRM|nr:ATP-dependent DNA helicase RecG [Selenobaculum gbiensis]WIW71854.1 ATP-dependent DNA helicase RecG [Selenobaculum gbiensis]